MLVRRWYQKENSLVAAFDTFCILLCFFAYSFLGIKYNENLTMTIASYNFYYIKTQHSAHILYCWTSDMSFSPSLGFSCLVFSFGPQFILFVYMLFALFITISLRYSTTNDDGQLRSSQKDLQIAPGAGGAPPLDRWLAHLRPPRPPPPQPYLMPNQRWWPRLSYTWPFS